MDQQSIISAAKIILDYNLNNLAKEKDKFWGKVRKIWMFVIVALIVGFITASLIK